MLTETTLLQSISKLTDHACNTEKDTTSINKRPDVQLRWSWAGNSKRLLVTTNQ